MQREMVLGVMEVYNWKMFPEKVMTQLKRAEG